MADFYLKSGAGAIVLANRAWTTTEKMVPTLADVSANVATGRKWVWECTTAGTSTGTPTWPASATQDVTTVTDNGVVWTARKPGFSTGTTIDWSFATIFFKYVCSAMAAGDTIFVSSAHSETWTASGSDSAIPIGTAAAPSQILCVTENGASRPTALTTGAVVACGSAVTFGIASAFLYVYGVQFYASVSSATLGFDSTANNSVCEYDNCTFRSASGGTINFNGTGNSPTSKVILRDPVFYFGATTQRINVYASEFDIIGGSLHASSSAVTGLLTLAGTAGRTPHARVTGFDMSLAASTAVLNTMTSSGRVVFRHCKLPGSWTGTLNSSAPTVAGFRSEMYNCTMASGAGSDHNYDLWIENLFGSVRHETSIVRTGGASDGTTAISWKMAGVADTEFPVMVLTSPEIVKWNETTGSAVTVTVEFLIDSATTLYTGDVWMETSYLGTSGQSLATNDVDSRLATVLTANTTECSAGTGVAGWANEAGTAKSYKLVSTITPQEKGFISVVIRLAKASTTIYVDPVLTVA